MEEVSLVLSGGGALGFAHIGVLEQIEEKGIILNEIIGTSIGSIIGTAYACGFSPKEIEDIVFNFHIKNIRNFNIKYLSLFSPKKAKLFLQDLFGDKTFKDCNFELKIIATKLNSNEIICFSSQNNVKLVDAIMASCAIPWALPPIDISGESYIDGYFSSNLPVEFATKKNIIAVDVLAKRILNNFEIKKPSFLKNLKNVYRIYERSIFLQIKYINNLKIKALHNKNIILVEPNTNAYSFLEFEKNTCKLIQEGKKEAKKFI